MDKNHFDPQALARRHYRENLWLRSLLTGVALGLERLDRRGRGEE